MSVDDIAEQPSPARSRTWGFYAVLCFAVIPLWSSVPLAWIFSLYSIYARTWPTYSPLIRALFFVSCSETLFSIYHIYLGRKVSRQAPNGPSDPEEIRIAYIRLLKAGLANLPSNGGDIETLLVDRPGSPAEAIVQLERHDPRAIQFRHSLRTWFCKVPFSTIKLHNIQKWLYWAIYNAEMPPVDQLPETHKFAVDEALALLQKRIGCKIDEGTDDTVKPMLLTIDKTNILWRPLTFYLLVAAINWWLRKYYALQLGLEHHYSHGIEYLIRTPRNWDPNSSPQPIVFLHGLGLGLLQYNKLISGLVRNYPDRPLLVPLQPQISQDFFHPHFLKPPSRHQMADSIAVLLKDLGWVKLETPAQVESDEESEIEDTLLKRSPRGVTVLSHSNGSYTHAWILKGYPEIASRSCFVDPVTFCSWEGDVCYNFIYRQCMTAMELLMRYFVGTEIGVANLLQRHFCWTSNSLWFEEIPRARDPHRTMFLLGGKDDIINSERVKLYLTSHGIRKNLWYDAEGRHGQALLPGSPGLHEVFRWLSEDDN